MSRAGSTVTKTTATWRRIAAGWASFWHYIGLGRYGEQLEYLFTLFPREQVLVLRYRRGTEQVRRQLLWLLLATAVAVVLIAVSQDAVKAGITKPGTGVSDIGALILEVIFTAGFIAVILASTKRVPALAPLAIPLTLVAIHFATATLSGASVNPARSIGSAVVGGDLSALWIYLVAPIVGAIAGWAAYMVIDHGGDEAVA